MIRDQRWAIGLSLIVLAMLAAKLNLLRAEDAALFVMTVLNLLLNLLTKMGGDDPPKPPTGG